MPFSLRFPGTRLHLRSLYPAHPTYSDSRLASPVHVRPRNLHLRQVSRQCWMTTTHTPDSESPVPPRRRPPHDSREGQAPANDTFCQYSGNFIPRRNGGSSSRHGGRFNWRRKPRRRFEISPGTDGPSGSRHSRSAEAALRHRPDGSSLERFAAANRRSPATPEHRHSVTL